MVKRCFNKCGKLLRVESGVRVFINNSNIEIGNKVYLHRQVKLSAWVKEGKAEIIIGDNTYIGDRVEILAGKMVKIG